MILLIDNYDSFTWNLYQAMAGLGAEVDVVRNDAISVEQALGRAPSAIVLSPGPGRPENAGICPDLLRRLPDAMPLLGVCLGHQGLVESYGGELEIDPVPTHGKAFARSSRQVGSLRRSAQPFPGGALPLAPRARTALPPELALTAWTGDGLVMAVRHVKLPRYGVQFHPESILTPQGERLLARFLERAGEAVVRR